MSEKVITAPENSKVLQVLKIMKNGKFRNLPITRKGKVVGIITSKDIISMLSE